MSTLSLRKIKHDSSSVDNITLGSNGHVGIGTDPIDSFNFGKALDISSTSGAFVYVRDSDATNGVGGIGYSGTDLYIGNKAVGNIKFLCNTDATLRMNIDSAGRVTMPYQPAFQTDEYGPGSISAGTQYVFKTNALHNIGNYYNSANGRFTAPVSGMYHFSFVVTPSSATSSPAIWIRKNGSSTPRYGLCLAYNTSYNAASCSPNIYLNANEYVEPIIEEWNGGTSLAIWSAQFGGFLIG